MHIFSGRHNCLIQLSLAAVLVYQLTQDVMEYWTRACAMDLLLLVFWFLCFNFNFYCYIHTWQCKAPSRLYYCIRRTAHSKVTMWLWLAWMAERPGFECWFDHLSEVAVLWDYFPGQTATCGLRGCKNWHAPFPGRMSYKAYIPGLVSILYLSMFNCVVVY